MQIPLRPVPIMPLVTYSEITTPSDLLLAVIHTPSAALRSFLGADFDYYDAVLSALALELRVGGRLVLDLYHREFFAAHQGTGTLERAGRKVVETKSMEGRRLTVHLDYGGGKTDTFGWELFVPEELAERAMGLGFHLVAAYSGFDEAVSPSPDRPRFQAIFEKD